jgi:hypothetical protein
MRATMIANALDASICPRFGRRRRRRRVAERAVRIDQIANHLAAVAERVGFEPTNTR